MAVTFPERLTECISVCAAGFYPAATAGPNNTTSCTNIGPVNMNKFHRIMGHVMMGVINANVTNVAVTFMTSNANNGTFTNVASGPVATLNTNNSDATLEINASQLPNTNTWIQMTIWTTTNTNVNNTAYLVGALYGSAAAYNPANQFDFSTNTSLLNRQVM